MKARGLAAAALAAALTCAGAAPCTALASEDGNTGSADVTVYRIPSGDGQRTETVDVGTGGFWDSLVQTGDGAALPALVALAASASALALAAGSKEHEEE